MTSTNHTQTMQILSMLQRAGDHGVTNKELSEVALQYNVHIHKLRHRWGHDVRKRRVYNGTRAMNTYIYYLVPGSRPVPAHIAKAKPAELPEAKPVEVPRLLEVDQVKRERVFF